MSSFYSDNLSSYHDKGKLGQPEIFEDEKEVLKKSKILAELIQSSNIITVHTGAGISTSCGIPDFRGPKGVWTLEKEGKKPDVDLNWDKACPSFTHRFLTELEKIGKLQYLISQNVDGLHMKSGFPRDKLAELHGNFFVQHCNSCNSETVFKKSCVSLGKKPTGKLCQKKNKKSGKRCLGSLHDSVLDWDQALPEKKLEISEKICKKSDLTIIAGSSMQIQPANQLPTYTKKNGGKIVIVNLQKTNLDKKADLVIHGYCDRIFESVADFLDLKIPANCDQVKIVEKSRNPLAIYHRSGELKPAFLKRQVKREQFEKVQVKRAKVEIELKTEGLEIVKVAS